MTRAEAASYPVSIFIAGSIWEAETVCRDYCDAIGFCVTVTETNYCYTGGEEGGIIVGLINYPRFPSTPGAIWARAEELAAVLRERLRQESYTIQAPDKTVWFSHRNDAAGETNGDQSETGNATHRDNTGIRKSLDA